MENHSRVESLQKYITVYKNLLSSVQSVGHSTKFLIFISLTSPAMYIVSFLQNVVPDRNYNLNFAFISTVCVLSAILPCLPAIFAELVKGEVDKIKVVLTKRLASEEAEVVRDKLHAFIKFMGLRPLQITIWRAIPIDMSLLRRIISFYTTFFIVMAQFMHSIN